MHGLPISTPTLRLRHIVRADALPMMALNAEPSTARWLPSHVYNTEGAAHEAIRYLIACCQDPGDPRQAPYVLAVDHAGTGQVLGHVGFSPLDGEVEISYAIAESARGRGLGVEAIVRGCEWAAATFGLVQVVALTEADNPASRRALQRASFGHEGDTARRFQGSRAVVSRYVWSAARSAA